MSSLVNSEINIRLVFFLGVLLVMALWELLAPRRPLTTNKPQRWISNLGLVLLNSIVLRLLVPVGAAGVALVAQSHGWGLFNNVSIPTWLTIAISVVALDFAIYLQHVMFHAIPVLWRLHMVHHADLDFDVTTGLRFHTIEIVLSFGIKCAAIVLVGASPLAVLIFEVMLNGTAMFNHSNVRIPIWLDRALRLVIVTPDMHRVHHSVIRREANSNFGFNLPWWDFLLGTYHSQPESGHEGMVIGLSQFRDERVERLPWMLLLPFIGKLGSYPINRGNGNSPPHEQRNSLRTQADQFDGSNSLDMTTQMNPMEDLADEYDRWFDSPEGQRIFEIELRCIQELLTVGSGRWLEVGVGTGRFAKALGITDGVDPSQPAMELARLRGINTRLGFAEKLPYEDGQFDGVLIVATFCFLSNPSRAMQECHRVLKLDGTLVLVIIPAESPWGQSYSAKGAAGHPFYSVAKFHTCSETLSIAKESGFVMDDARCCLLSSPHQPLSTEIRPGVLKNAGCVCMRFVRDDLNGESLRRSVP